MENVRKLLVLMLLTGIACFGCVKDPQDIPAGITTNPVFGLIGQLGNESLNIHAGENGWTDQPLTGVENSAGVYHSLFSKNACTGSCTPSLAFTFYTAATPSGNPEGDFLQTINKGAKEFVLSHQQRDSFEISVNTDPGLFMSGYSSWQNQNDSITSLAQEFRDVIGYGQNLEVCFQSLAFTGCQYSQCIYFNPATLTPCLASVHATYEDSRTVSLTVVPEMGTPPFQYSWFDQSDDQSILVYHQDSTAEFYAGVMVTDAAGNRAIINQTIRLQGSFLDQCFFPIGLQSIAIPNNAPNTLFDRVEISYTDENGIQWSSTAGIQHQTPLFVINEVKYFGLSPQQRPAYQVTCDVLVDLFNDAGENKKFVVQGATIALAY